MKLKSSVVINENACAADIVKAHYRTAAVFRKYGIEYCCGARWPLKMLLDDKPREKETLLTELEQACQVLMIPGGLSYEQWSLDFLIDYITNIHHAYLRNNLPAIRAQVSDFVQEHLKKYPFLHEVERKLNFLEKTMLPHLQQEEEVIFPYIRQISHAYTSKESYATLLVRTLRKPVEELMDDEHSVMENTLFQLRELTGNYGAPEGACTSHRLAYALLKELDDDLVQHIYLENDVLFPKAIALEKELLARP